MPDEATPRKVSAKPGEAPAFDASVTWSVLNAELKKDDGSSYQVFQEKSFPRWKRWVGGELEYDGKGLKDVVEANAYFLDQVKGDLDAHKENDNIRHATIASRLAALEDAVANPPFPG